MEVAAKAETFLNVGPISSSKIIVDVLTGPSSTGLCKVAYGRKVLARHIDRLTPVNEEARKLLKKN